MLLLPVGAGKTVELPNPNKLTDSSGGVRAGPPTGRVRGRQRRDQNIGYVQDIDTGTTRPFTSKGITPASYNTVPISPDGARVWLEGPDGRSYLYPLAGGTPAPLPGVEPGERVIRWTADSTGIFVSNLRGVPQRIARVDVRHGTPHTRQGTVAVAGLRYPSHGDFDDARRAQCPLQLLAAPLEPLRRHRPEVGPPSDGPDEL